MARCSQDFLDAHFEHLGADGQMALRMFLEAHFEHFWVPVLIWVDAPDSIFWVDAVVVFDLMQHLMIQLLMNSLTRQSMNGP